MTRPLSPGRSASGLQLFSFFSAKLTVCHSSQMFMVLLVLLNLQIESTFKKKGTESGAINAQIGFQTTETKRRTNVGSLPTLNFHPHYIGQKRSKFYYPLIAPYRFRLSEITLEDPELDIDR